MWAVRLVVAADRSRVLSQEQGCQSGHVAGLRGPGARAKGELVSDTPTEEGCSTEAPGSAPRPGRPLAPLCVAEVATSRNSTRGASAGTVGRRSEVMGETLACVCAQGSLLGVLEAPSTAATETQRVACKASASPTRLSLGSHSVRCLTDVP